MKNILKTYPVVSTLTFICLLLGILTSIYGNAMYDLLAFHSKPVYYWQYMSGTLMHGSKGAPLWFLWVHLFLNGLMILPFGGLLERKRGSKHVLLVFVTATVISSIAFHFLTQGRKNSGDGDFCGWLCFYNWRSHTFTEYLERIFMHRKTVLSFLNPSS